MTVLMNDKLNRSHDYEISRKTALALGLDWSHFHENTSTYPDDDPEGKCRRKKTKRTVYIFLIFRYNDSNNNGVLFIGIFGFKFNSIFWFIEKDLGLCCSMVIL